MSYYFNTTLTCDFETAIQKVTNALKQVGFGIVTEMDLQTIFKKKLNKDFRPYRILGACNPNFAFQALAKEDKVGTMLPCNIIVQELENGQIEVAAVNPKASMKAIQNKELATFAEEVEVMLKSVIEGL